SPCSRWSACIRRPRSSTTSSTATSRSCACSREPGRKEALDDGFVAFVYPVVGGALACCRPRRRAGPADRQERNPFRVQAVGCQRRRTFPQVESEHRVSAEESG